ncbi:hypothetical protein [Hydrogenovibrio marinus]|nr:hypothetical protein [Hydrogenovibrio marinus]
MNQSSPEATVKQLMLQLSISDAQIRLIESIYAGNIWQAEQKGADYKKSALAYMLFISKLCREHNINYSMSAFYSLLNPVSQYNIADFVCRYEKHALAKDQALSLEDFHNLVEKKTIFEAGGYLLMPGEEDFVTDDYGLDTMATQWLFSDGQNCEKIEWLRHDKLIDVYCEMFSVDRSHLSKHEIDLIYADQTYAESYQNQGYDGLQHYEAERTLDFFHCLSKIEGQFNLLPDIIAIARDSSFRQALLEGCTFEFTTKEDCGIYPPGLNLTLEYGLLPDKENLTFKVYQGDKLMDQQQVTISDLEKILTMVSDYSVPEADESNKTIIITDILDRESSSGTFFEWQQVSYKVEGGTLTESDIQKFKKHYPIAQFYMSNFDPQSNTGTIHDLNFEFKVGQTIEL